MNIARATSKNRVAPPAQLLLDEIVAVASDFETDNVRVSSARLQAAVRRGMKLFEAGEITVDDMHAVNRAAMDANWTLRRLTFGKRI
jgi:hypothetical protein